MGQLTTAISLGLLALPLKNNERDKIKVKIGIELNQEKINKRSGRKCQDFEVAEREYQIAQKEWKENKNNLKSWQKMFTLISTAVFNTCNRKLEHILDKEEIEQRAMDITCGIMAGIKKKRAEQEKWDIDAPRLTEEVKSMSFFSRLTGKAKNTLINSTIEIVIGKRPVWEIEKVSSAVYLPCLAIYSEKLQFEDKILGEDSYTVEDEDGNTSIMEFEDSYMENGIYHLHR